MKKALIASLLALGVMGNASALTLGNCPKSMEEAVKRGWQDLDPSSSLTEYSILKSIYAVPRINGMQIICVYSQWPKTSPGVGSHRRLAKTLYNIGASYFESDHDWFETSIPDQWGCRIRELKAPVGSTCPRTGPGNDMCYNFTCKFPIDAW
jgi:hypothetical protein